MSKNQIVSTITPAHLAAFAETVSLSLPINNAQVQYLMDLTTLASIEGYTDVQPILDAAIAANQITEELSTLIQNETITDCCFE